MTHVVAFKLDVSRSHHLIKEKQQQQGELKSISIGREFHKMRSSLA
jgi:hypothetical protein